MSKLISNLQQMVYSLPDSDNSCYVAELYNQIKGLRDEIRTLDNVKGVKQCY